MADALEVVRGLYREAEPVTEAQAATAREALLGLIDAERSAAGGRRKLPSLSLKRVMPLAAMGVAAAGAIIVLAGTPVSDVPVSSAADVLRKAAAAEQSLAPGVPGPGQYLYVRSSAAYLTSVATAPPAGSAPGTRSAPQALSVAYSYLQPHVREVWMSESGSVLRTRTDPPEFLSDEDRRAWEGDGRPDAAGGVSVDRLGSNPAERLPEDPDLLLAKLRSEAALELPGRMGVFGERAEGSGVEVPEFGAAEIDAVAFERIGERIREGSLSSAQQAALFEAAAMLEGIELDDEVVDPAGRPGIAVSTEDGWRGVTHTFIFDPETYALLAERDVVSSEEGDDRYSVGTVIGQSVYEERRIVDDVPASLRDRV